jgi:hypothetical protein
VTFYCFVRFVVVFSVLHRLVLLLNKWLRTGTGECLDPPEAVRCSHLVGVLVLDT